MLVFRWPCRRDDPRREFVHLSPCEAGDRDFSLVCDPKRCCGIAILKDVQQLLREWWGRSDDLHFVVSREVVTLVWQHKWVHTVEVAR